MVETEVIEHTLSKPVNPPCAWCLSAMFEESLYSLPGTNRHRQRRGRPCPISDFLSRLSASLAPHRFSRPSPLAPLSSPLYPPISSGVSPLASFSPAY